MKNRNIAWVMVWSLLTLGVYMIFWLKYTKDEMNARGTKIPRLLWMFAPLLGVLAVSLLALLVNLALGSSEAAGSLKTIFNVILVILGVLLLLASIPIGFWWMYKYSEGVEYVTRGQTTLGFSFGLYIILSLVGVSFVWPGLIQDAFNKVDGPATMPGTPPHAAAHPFDAAHPHPAAHPHAPHAPHAAAPHHQAAAPHSPADHTPPPSSPAGPPHSPINS